VVILAAQAQLEFFKSRLIDSIEEKRKKVKTLGGDGPSAGSSTPIDGKGRKQALEPTGCLPTSFARLKPEEIKADLEELNTNVDHYSVRNAASGATEAANSANATDAYFDKQRQMLHCNGLALERGMPVIVLQQGQRVDNTWVVHAMNAVEVTLRDSDSTKLKVTLAQVNARRPDHPWRCASRAHPALRRSYSALLVSRPALNSSAPAAMPSGLRSKGCDRGARRRRRHGRRRRPLCEQCAEP
jgi:predicted double-glycine peptidase